jgi:hypothetical protein
MSAHQAFSLVNAQRVWTVTFVRFRDDYNLKRRAHNGTDWSSVLSQTLFDDMDHAGDFICDELLRQIKDKGFTDDEIAQCVDVHYRNETGDAIADEHLHNLPIIESMASNFFEGQRIARTIDWQMEPLRVYTRKAAAAAVAAADDQKDADDGAALPIQDPWLVTFLHFCDSEDTAVSPTYFNDMNNADFPKKDNECNGVISQTLFEDIDSAEHFMCAELLRHLKGEDTDASVAQRVDKKYLNETGDAISEAHISNLASMADMAKTFFRGEYVARTLHWMLRQLPVHKTVLLDDVDENVARKGDEMGKRRGNAPPENEPAAKIAKLTK